MMTKKHWKDLNLEERHAVKTEADLLAREGNTEKEIEEATGYKFYIYGSYIPGTDEIIKGSEYTVCAE